MNTRQTEYYAIKKPGSKTAEVFLAMNDELARELCLAMEWDYVGPVEPPQQEARRKPAAPKTPKTPKTPKAPKTYGNPLLTGPQIKALAITARQAFDHLDAFGLIEQEGESRTARFDAWRAKVCHGITGRRSFRELRNGDFRLLKAELLKLAGRRYDDPQALLSGKQSAAPGDTMEAREQFMERIVQDLWDHAHSGHENAGQISHAYVMTVAKRKNPTWNLSDFSSLIGLPAKQLEELHWTIRNRIAAKEGRGETEKRNKKQKGQDE